MYPHGRVVPIQHVQGACRERSESVIHYDFINFIVKLIKSSIMENFVKTSFEFVDGNVVAGVELMPRSLVLMNDKGAIYNIAAKVRNTDKFSVIRALVKAVLVSLREVRKLNSTKASQESKKRVANKIAPALSSHAIMITDKNGNIIPSSILSVREDAKETGRLRDVIRITKSMPIYKLVVEQGLDWSDLKVVHALDAWTTAAIEQMNYVKNLDAALGEAADSTEREEKAMENAVEEILEIAA